MNKYYMFDMTRVFELNEKTNPVRQPFLNQLRDYYGNNTKTSDFII